MSHNSIFATQKSSGGVQFSWGDTNFPNSKTEDSGRSFIAYNNPKFVVLETNTNNFAIKDTGPSSSKIGIYYSWYTATAGSGVSNLPTYTDINDSICPKGWRLPIGAISNNNKSYYYSLKNIYEEHSIVEEFTNLALSQFPLNYPPTGYYAYNLGAARDTTSRQEYWTATSGKSANEDSRGGVTTSTMGFYMRSGALRIYYGNFANYSYDGLQMRCISR